MTSDGDKANERDNTLKREPSTAAALAFAVAVILTGCTSRPDNPETQQIPPVVSKPATTSGSAQEESAVNDTSRKPSNSKVALHVGQRVFAVELYDNPTAKDLVSRLPITVKADNYPGYDEKLLRLPSPLSMQGAPEGDEPKIPEVGYYQPGQWIALYYGPIGYWPGKVPLGQIDASADELRSIPADTPVTIAVPGK